MVNMGFSDLILIDPKCDLDFEARQAAANGQGPLSQVQIFESWDQFNQSCDQGLRLAFSAKDGQSRIVMPLMETLQTLNQFNPFSEDTPVYFIFGPEDWGLSNEDLGYCHRSVVIPTYGPNSSLNLAQAVLLGLYSYRQFFGGQVTDIRQRTEESDFVQDPEWFPDSSLIKFLTAMRFDLSDRRVSAYSTLKQFFLRAVPTIKEKRLLASVFEQAARKISSQPKSGD